jgi:hypothetical protein
MVFKTAISINTDAITAETLAVNNSRWCSKNTAINNTDAITAEATTRAAAIMQKLQPDTAAITARNFSQNNSRWCSKHSYFHNTDAQQQKL